MKFMTKIPEKEQAILLKRQLEANRQPWESLWQQIAGYILPRKGRFAGETHEAASARNALILDGAAQKALRILSAGMQGGLTSPARPWFRLGLPDPDMETFGPVKNWLDSVERRIFAALAQSNFYGAVHTLYGEMAAFGTGAIVSEQAESGGLVFRVLTTGRYSIGCGPDNRVDAICRTVFMEARNLAARFGEENLSPRARELASTRPDEPVEIVHCVFPRKGYDPQRRDAHNLPFASLWWEADKSDLDSILSVSGFVEFPALVPRWDVTAEEVYGRSPGMDALGDVKMLQEIAKDEIKALHKAVDPPMQVPAAFKGRLSLLPGAQNRVSNAGPDAAPVRPLYQVGVNLAHTAAKIQDLRMAVREHFFNDLFLMILERPGMTATEVLERHEEKMLLLGPVIERQEHELLNPLIARVFGILFRAGALPAPPASIAGGQLKVEYISLLAQAQKMSGARALQSTVGFVGQLAGALPHCLDRLDADEAIKAFAKMMGAPARIIRADDQVEKIRQARLEVEGGAAPGKG
jgi:hypothetical protein